VVVLADEVLEVEEVEEAEEAEEAAEVLDDATAAERDFGIGKAGEEADGDDELE